MQSNIKKNTINVTYINDHTCNAIIIYLPSAAICSRNAFLSLKAVFPAVNGLGQGNALHGYRVPVPCKRNQSIVLYVFEIEINHDTTFNPGLNLYPFKIIKCF